MKSDEKKITLDDLEELMEEEQESQSIFSFQNLFAMLVLNWQWFLLSLFIFGCGALLYLRYADPVYEVSSRLLIKDDNSHRRNSSQMLANMQDLGFMTNSTGIDNEVEILQSRILVRDAVKDLKLYTEYKREGRVKDQLIYATQPITVDLDPIHLDSLDKELLDVARFFKLHMHYDGVYYIVNIVLTANGKQEQSIWRKFKTLPVAIPTNYGVLTFTKNLRGEPMKSERDWFITIAPPMLVATGYLGRMTVEPTSKLTDIAEITLRDQDTRRAIDFLNQFFEYQFLTDFFREVRLVNESTYPSIYGKIYSTFMEINDQYFMYENMVLEMPIYAHLLNIFSLIISKNPQCSPIPLEDVKTKDKYVKFKALINHINAHFMDEISL